jgi:hypothetical protein
VELRFFQIGFLQLTLIDGKVGATPPAMFFADWRSMGGFLVEATPPADSGEHQWSMGGLPVSVGDSSGRRATEKSIPPSPKMA